MGNVASVEQNYFVQKIRLGKGSSSTVWRGIDQRTGHVVAIKELTKASLSKRGVDRTDISREVELMGAVKHENIMELYDRYEDAKSIFLAVEYCEGGDFGDKLRERGMCIDENTAANWTHQICSAILALHTSQICHRDIKPDNFMLAGFTLKLSDFGLACFLSPGKLLTDKVGTPAFMAPEQIMLPTHSQGYGFPCDMWAAGICMYMMMFGGLHPFFHGTRILDCQMLIRGKLDFRGPSRQGALRYSEAARKICTAMVEPDPGQRLTAYSAVHSPWFANRGFAEQRRVGSRAMPRQPSLSRRGMSKPVVSHPGDGKSQSDYAHVARKEQPMEAPMVSESITKPPEIGAFFTPGSLFEEFTQALVDRHYLPSFGGRCEGDIDRVELRRGCEGELVRLPDAAEPVVLRTLEDKENRKTDPFALGGRVHRSYTAPVGDAGRFAALKQISSVCAPSSPSLVTQLSYPRIAPPQSTQIDIDTASCPFTSPPTAQSPTPRNEMSSPFPNFRGLASSAFGSQPMTLSRALTPPRSRSDIASPAFGSQPSPAFGSQPMSLSRPLTPPRSTSDSLCSTLPRFGNDVTPRNLSRPLVLPVGSPIRGGYPQSPVQTRGKSPMPSPMQSVRS